MFLKINIYPSQAVIMRTQELHIVRFLPLAEVKMGVAAKLREVRKSCKGFIEDSTHFSTTSTTKDIEKRI